MAGDAGEDKSFNDKNQSQRSQKVIHGGQRLVLGARRRLAAHRPDSGHEWNPIRSKHPIGRGHLAGAGVGGAAGGADGV